MRSIKKFSLVLLQSCLFLAMFLGIGACTTVAVAQERRSERNVDRGDSDDRRGQRRSAQRDRSDSNRDESGSDASSRDSSSTRESNENSSDDSPGIAMADYAKGLIKLHDKNGNMMLEGDELRALRPPASLADANNDKVITIDELIARLSSPASKTSSGSSSTASGGESTRDLPSRGDEGSDRRDRGSFFGSRRDDRNRNSDRGQSQGDSKSAMTYKRVLTWTGDSGKVGDDEKQSRRTYRFTPAREKLPTGLPSWFKSQDKNGDGQVAMSEYSRTWSKNIVSKFRGYDLNDDGVITAKEAGGKK